jgi:hypothetical protein
MRIRLVRCAAAHTRASRGVSAHGAPSCCRFGPRILGSPGGGVHRRARRVRCAGHFTRPRHPRRTSRTTTLCTSGWGRMARRLSPSVYSIPLPPRASPSLFPRLWANKARPSSVSSEHAHRPPAAPRAGQPSAAGTHARTHTAQDPVPAPVCAWLRAAHSWPRDPPVKALSRTSARRSSESQSWLNHSPGPRNHSPGGHELRLSAAGASAGTVPRPAHALQTHTERPARARIAKFALPKRAPGSSGASRQGRRPSAGRAHRRAQRCRQDLCIDSPCRVRPRRVGAAQASRPRGWRCGVGTEPVAKLVCTAKSLLNQRTPPENTCVFFLNQSRA